MPENSLLMARLTAAGDARMPKGGEPLSEAECKKIAEWINRARNSTATIPRSRSLN